MTREKTAKVTVTTTDGRSSTVEVDAQDTRFYDEAPFTCDNVVSTRIETGRDDD